MGVDPDMVVASLATMLAQAEGVELARERLARFLVNDVAWEGLRIMVRDVDRLVEPIVSEANIAAAMRQARPPPLRSS